MASVAHLYGSKDSTARLNAPTAKPTIQESQPAGLKPARGPFHFLPARRIVGQHRAADRPERSADDHEHPNHLGDDSRDRQDRGNQGTDAHGDATD